MVSPEASHLEAVGFGYADESGHPLRSLDVEQMGLVEELVGEARQPRKERSAPQGAKAVKDKIPVSEPMRRLYGVALLLAVAVGGTMIWLKSRGADSNEHAEPPVATGGVSLPDKLLSADDGPCREHVSSDTSNRFDGDVSVSEPARSPYCIAALLAMALIGALIWLAGYVQREGFLDLPYLAQEPGMAVVSLESRGGVELMVGQANDVSQVMVRRADQSSWLLVSQGDMTARNPSLSPGAGEVAYLTQRSTGQIAIVSIVTNTRRTVSADQMQDAGKSGGFDSISLCPWTPIAWSPTGQAIAFFGCAEDDAFSVAVVADLSTSDLDLAIVGASKAEASEDRQLEWLDAEHLVVNTPTSAKDQPTVQTFEVP